MNEKRNVIFGWMDFSEDKCVILQVVAKVQFATEAEAEENVEDMALLLGNCDYVFPDVHDIEWKCPEQVF